MDTIRVQRANVILDIRPDDKARFMEQGYSVIDAKSGKVIEAALSNDVNTLRTEVKSLREQLAVKDVLLAEKDAEIEKLKAKKKKSAEE